MRNRMALKSGTGSPLIVSEAASFAMEHIIKPLETEFPLLQGDYTAAKQLLAQVLGKLALEEAYVADLGEYNARGQLRPQAQRADRLRQQAFQMIESLAGTPKARVSMGIRLVRDADDLASQIARLRSP